MIQKEKCHRQFKWLQIALSWKVFWRLICREKIVWEPQKENYGRLAVVLQVSHQSQLAIAFFRYINSASNRKVYVRKIYIFIIF